MEEGAMALAANAHEHRTMFDRIGGWWRQWRDQRAVLAALDRCGRAEVERMAHDVGLGGNDLQVLAGKWPDGAALLERRIELLGLDRASVGLTEPQVMRDLQRVCSICDNKHACEHDLDRNPGSAVWQDYCPNVETFRALAGRAATPPTRR